MNFRYIFAYVSFTSSRIVNNALCDNGLVSFAPGLPAARVDAALRQAVQAMEKAQECAVLWFAEVARRALYRELGHASLELYAMERLGFSRNRYFQFLRLAQDLERLPRLRAAVENGDLGWTKAQQVARVATPASEEAWIETATTVGRRELASEVKRARERAKRRRKAARVEAPRLELSGAAAGCEPVEVAVADPPTTITLRLDGVQLARFEALLEQVRKSGSSLSREDVVLAGLASLVAEGGELCRRNSRKSLPGVQIVVRRCDSCGEAAVVTREGDRRLDPAQTEALACDARVQAEGGPNRATIPPSVRAAVLARDGHRCATPGCSETRFLEVHHRTPRERGGSNRPENLVTLCSRCHRFEHERGRAAGRPGDHAQPVPPIRA